MLNDKEYGLRLLPKYKLEEPLALDTSKAVERLRSYIVRSDESDIYILVPSSLNTIPEESPEKPTILYESPVLNEAVVTVVALSLFETVKVALSLMVPVSSRAVRSWLGIIYIVNVFVLFPLPVSSVKVNTSVTFEPPASTPDISEFATY